jgi:hypothetical protein
MIKNIYFIIAIQFLTLGTAYSNEKIPFFDGTTLKIPVVSTPERPGSLRNVEFKFTDGKWQLSGYKGRVPMPGIKKVEMFLTEELPIQGYLKIQGGGIGSSCIHLELIRQQLVGNTFEVFIDSDPRYPISACTRDIGFFTKIIPLPLYGLKRGEYKYTVNGGFSGVFSLSSDNNLTGNEVNVKDE